ncbi:MAG: cell division protein ZapA [Clostridiales bacterium]|nr:cell division protein ZapA [Clostridiales bacterium]
MSNRNTVTVRIYGQEYNISGEQSREQIMRIADYVDGKMHKIGESFKGSASSAAVLTAVNIAAEYFEREAEIEELREAEASFKSEVDRYSLLWEEAKDSLAQYKEQMAGSRRQQEENIRTFEEKNERMEYLSNQLREVEGHNEVLRARVEELTIKLSMAEEAPEAAQREIRELEEKCRDIESSFFDIQMENIHLKNDLEALRKRLNR